MPALSLRRNLFHYFLATCLGGGLGLLLVSLIYPQAFVELWLLRAFVWLWIALVSGFFLLIVKRLLGKDPVPGERPRLASGWDERNARRQHRGYARDTLNKQARYAQALAERDAIARQGVEVAYKPKRESKD